MSLTSTGYFYNFLVINMPSFDLLGTDNISKTNY